MLKIGLSKGTVLLLVLGLCFGSFKAGEWFTLGHDQKLSQEYTATQKLMVQVQNENADLVKKLNSAERNFQIQLEAKKNLVNHLKILQDYNAELTQNMSLYQTVAGTPSRSKQGVLVKNFQVHPASEPQTFRYSVLLAKKVSGQEMVQGAVSMVITGKIGDKSILLPVKYVNSGREDGLPFQFQHFQELSGELGLPKDFIAQEVLFKIKPDKGLPSLRQQFPWMVDNA